MDGGARGWIRMPRLTTAFLWIALSIADALRTRNVITWCGAPNWAPILPICHSCAPAILTINVLKSWHPSITKSLPSLRSVYRFGFQVADFFSFYTAVSLLSLSFSSFIYHFLSVMQHSRGWRGTCKNTSQFESCCVFELYQTACQRK